MIAPARAAAAALLLALGGAAAGCSDRAVGNTPAPPPLVPVTAAVAVEKLLPLQVTAVGNVQPFTTVGIKSQIDGQVMTVHFREGQTVKRGDLLFTIDPRPFQAALRQAEANVARDVAARGQAEAELAQREAEVDQAEANLARDQAQLDNARSQEERYQMLLERELIAREQYDQVRTAMASLLATVAADRAAIANARAALVAARAAVDNTRAVIRADEAAVERTRLQLAYTTIHSPLDGRTGNLLVQAGNLVKANADTPMVVINQVRPILLSFAVPEHHLADIRRFWDAGALQVAARLPSQATTLATGRLTFINNTTDQQTGTIQLKATFANADDALWPGQFLDAVLTLAEQRAVVVPSTAILPGQRGPYVFVVKADGTVEARPVEPGLRLGGETAIAKGLQPGEQVVTDGQLRLAPGTKVEIKPAPARS
jgi:multidrug efflux system membrane fusion protein